MSRRLLLLTTSWVGALATLMLLTFALKAHTPAQSTMVDSPAFVSITASGIDPAMVTITVGSKVVWTNLTQETVHLIGEESYRVNLPVLLSNVSGTGLTAGLPKMSAATIRRQAEKWMDVQVAAGKTHTETFANAGHYPYYLAGRADRTGLVIVAETPDFALGVWPTVQRATWGHSVNYAVTVTAVQGFTQTVALSAGGMPTGTTFSWANNPLTPTANTTLAITPSVSSPTGAYALHITGTGGGQVHSVPFTLTILPCTVDARYECQYRSYVPPAYCECTHWAPICSGGAIPSEQWVAYTDLTCENGAYSFYVKYHYSLGFLVNYTEGRTYLNSGNTYTFEVDCSFEHPYQGAVTGGVFGTEIRSFDFSHERYCMFCLP